MKDALIPKEHSKTGICLVLIIFFFLGLCFNYYTPLWNPPDEERHFIYCEYLAQNHKLPEYSLNPQGNFVSMSFHPPLYYLIGSFFFVHDRGLLEEEISINDGPGFNTITHPKREWGSAYSGKVRTAYLLRLFSLILSGITLYLIYLICLTLYPGDNTFAAATALFVATIPQFLHFSASISNETLSTTLSTAYLFSLLYFLKEPHKLKWLVIGGILFGLCLMSRTFSIFYIPVTVCFLCWVYARDKKTLIKSLCSIFGMAVSVSGWWYLRNWLKFDDPLFSKTVEKIDAWHLQQPPVTLKYIILLIKKTFATFFGGFGSLQFTIPDYHFAVYGALVLMGSGGLWWLLTKKNVTTFQSHAIVLFLFALGGGLGLYAYLNIKYSGFCLGRYLFIIIAPIAILIFMGLRYLIPSKIKNLAFILIAFVLVVLNLNGLFRILKPAYADPLLVEGVDQQKFCCSTPEIKSNTTIGQTFISPKNNLCAIRVMVSKESKPLEGQLKFILKEEGNDNKVLYQIAYPLDEVEDFSRYFFIFPPVPHSMGKAYEFYFTASPQPPDKGIALWYEAKSNYDKGKLTVNGKAWDGTLYFTTYHFTGDCPKTDWQGRREMVISQGLYATIRELQLYAERSEDVKVKTITHEKVLQSEKALNNRRVQTQKH